MFLGQGEPSGGGFGWETLYQREAKIAEAEQAAAPRFVAEQEAAAEARAGFTNIQLAGIVGVVALIAYTFTPKKRR